MKAKARLVEWDKQYIWHPFTQMKDWLAMEPLLIERGEGSYLVDIEGRRYIDGVSSLWVLVHGHGKRELVEALKGQAEKLCHSTLLGLASETSIRLAKKLIEIAPAGLTKVFYSDNGSTSVEIALKMAYQYWRQKGEKQRKLFLSFTNGYHGDTIGSVSVGGIDLFHKVYGPLLFKTVKAPSPYCYRCPLKLSPEDCGLACVEEFEKKVKKHADRLCAVVIEPAVQGAGGMIVQPPGFLKAVRQIAKAHGLLFIADEVATGFGRTGAMFACLEEGVSPDFLCTAKGITGGYLPLAATLSTEKVYRAFLGRYDEFKTFFHGHTYTANPLACAAALANLEIFKKEKVLARLKPRIAHLARELAALAELPYVGEVRQLGLMAGIELVKDRASGEEYPAQRMAGARVCAACRPRGLIVRPLGDVIVLMPPLSISNAQITEMVGTVRAAAEAVLKTGEK